MNVRGKCNAKGRLLPGGITLFALTLAVSSAQPSNQKLAVALYFVRKYDSGEWDQAAACSLAASLRSTFHADKIGEIVKTFHRAFDDLGRGKGYIKRIKFIEEVRREAADRDIYQLFDRLTKKGDVDSVVLHNVCDVALFVDNSRTFAPHPSARDSVFEILGRPDLKWLNAPTYLFGNTVRPYRPDPNHRDSAAMMDCNDTITDFLQLFDFLSKRPAKSELFSNRNKPVKVAIILTDGLWSTKSECSWDYPTSHMVAEARDALGRACREYWEKDQFLVVLPVLVVPPRGKLADAVKLNRSLLWDSIIGFPVSLKPSDIPLLEMSQATDTTLRRADSICNEILRGFCFIETRVESLAVTGDSVVCLIKTPARMRDALTVLEDGGLQGKYEFRRVSANCFRWASTVQEVEKILHKQDSLNIRLGSSGNWSREEHCLNIKFILHTPRVSFKPGVCSVGKVRFNDISRSSPGLWPYIVFSIPGDESVERADLLRGKHREVNLPSWASQPFGFSVVHIRTLVGAALQRRFEVRFASASYLIPDFWAGVVLPLCIGGLFLLISYGDKMCPSWWQNRVLQLRIRNTCVVLTGFLMGCLARSFSPELSWIPLVGILVAWVLQRLVSAPKWATKKWMLSAVAILFLLASIYFLGSSLLRIDDGGALRFLPSETLQMVLVVVYILFIILFGFSSPQAGPLPSARAGTPPTEMPPTVSDSRSEPDGSRAPPAGCQF